MYSRYPFADGGLVDPRTGKWTPIPRAPFKPAPANPQMVWTGRELVVMGSQCLKDRFIEGGYDGCSRSRTRLATYTPSTREWRRLDVPSEFLKSFFGRPLLWTGHEAWFGATEFAAVNPRSGETRTLPKYPGNPSLLGGDNDTCASEHWLATVEIADGPAPDRVPTAGPIYLLGRGEEWEKIDPPVEAASPGESRSHQLGCSKKSIVLISSAYAKDFKTVASATLWRHDLDGVGWKPFEVPILRGNDLSMVSGYGHLVDLWSDTQNPGARFDLRTESWSETSGGPWRGWNGPGGIAWAGDLLVTYGSEFASGQSELLKWVPVQSK